MSLSIIPVHFASMILENLNLAVYVRESVCVRLIVHDTSPLTRILLLVHCHYGEFKGLVDGNTIIDGGAAAVLGVLPSEKDRRSGKRSTETVTCRPRLPQTLAVAHS